MKYRAKEPETVIQASDGDGNVLEPITFGKDGTLTVSDKDSDLIAILEDAVAAGTVERVEETKKESR
jgi:hypothetical protein